MFFTIIDIRMKVLSSPLLPIPQEKANLSMTVENTIVDFLVFFVHPLRHELDTLCCGLKSD